MAEIFPFAAYRYNPARVELDRVLTQPYDKITPEMQERYASLSPYNLIPVEKGRVHPDDTPESNVYTRAAAKLREWMAEGVLLRDSRPAIYLYSQEYVLPGTTHHQTRKGFIALGRLHDYAEGVVFRHEQTLSAPRADRLELLRHTRTQTGQLFMLYSDPARRLEALFDSIARVPAPVEAHDEYGVAHRVWPVVATDVIEHFRAAMASQKLVIADGHHRYETALAYREACRLAGGSGHPDAPHERAMMTFINAHSEGLTVLPTHRLVAGLAALDFAAFRSRLRSAFEEHTYAFPRTSDREGSYAGFRQALAGHREQRAIGAYAGTGAFYLFVLRPDADRERLLPGVSLAQRNLDVVLLHRLMLEAGLGITAEAVARGEHVAYEREMDRAISAVDAGRAQACFLLNPVRVEQVVEMAFAGEVLPQKSTDFYPKLLSGLTLYRLDG